MIPFNKPTFIGKEIDSLNSAISSDDLDSSVDDVCNFLKLQSGFKASYFCNSCSDALEISALAMDLSIKDEIIVPDYTFVTSASSFALRGAKIIFCDVNEEDLSLDLEMAEKLITKRTRAIIWVDYAGSSSRAQQARKLCDNYGLVMVQDAAQSIGNWIFSPYKDCFQGDFITYSFHSTKNLQSGGEGGALLIGNEEFLEITEMIFEKGTNRRSFIRNEVDKYTWHTLGSSYAGSFSQAAFLRPQLNDLEKITHDRRLLWNDYFENLRSSDWIQNGWKIPLGENLANAHTFWILAPSMDLRNKLLDFCNSHGVQLSSHYQSLGKSPAGVTYGEVPLNIRISEIASKCLLRLPLWHGMTLEDTKKVFEVLSQFPKNNL